MRPERFIRDKRLRVTVKGIVQGVGFRPFIYRLANKYNLSGFVENTSKGVNIEIQGKEGNIEDFLEETNCSFEKETTSWVITSGSS